MTVLDQDKGPSSRGRTLPVRKLEQRALARGLVVECLDSTSSVPRWKTGTSHTLGLTGQAHGLSW